MATNLFNNYWNNPTKTKIYSSLVCPGASSADEISASFEDGQLVISDGKNTLASMDLSGINSGLSEWSNSSKILGPHTINFFEGESAGKSYKGYAFGNIPPQAFADPEISFEDFIRGIDVQVDYVSKTNEPTRADIHAENIDELNDKFRELGINVTAEYRNYKYDSVNPTNLIGFKSGKLGYEYYIGYVNIDVPAYLLDPDIMDENVTRSVMLEELLSLHVPSTKYRNGAFKGVCVVPQYPQYNADDIDSTRRSLQIAHVHDRIDMYSKVDDEKARRGDIPFYNGRIYSSVERLRDHLYRTNFYKLKYADAMKYFENTYRPTYRPFGCSAVVSGKYYGRNLDWTYDDNVEFIVRTPRTDVHHGTICVCGCIPGLTEGFVKSGVYDDIYELIPFFALDGINDCGVACNVNVVPGADGYGPTRGTCPGAQFSICSQMLVRYVLDHFPTARMAVEGLKHVNIYQPTGASIGTYDFHFMITDAHETFVVEFIKGELVSIKKKAMTNFYLHEAGFDKTNGHVIRETITPHGAGIERYDIIMDSSNDASKLAGMKELMRDKLRYSRIYDEESQPIWYTEFVGDYGEELGGDFTVMSPPEQLSPAILQHYRDYAKETFEGGMRNRESKPWFTTHTSIYDLELRKLWFVCQEDDTQEFVFTFDEDFIMIPKKDKHEVLAPRFERHVFDVFGGYFNPEEYANCHILYSPERMDHIDCTDDWLNDGIGDAWINMEMGKYGSIKVMRGHVCGTYMFANWATLNNMWTNFGDIYCVFAAPDDEDAPTRNLIPGFVIHNPNDFEVKVNVMTFV